MYALAFEHNQFVDVSRLSPEIIKIDKAKINCGEFNVTVVPAALWSKCKEHACKK